MRFLIIVLIGLAVAGCSNNYPPPPPLNTGKYAPEINPNPKYFMTVRGYIDPQLKNKIPLKIIAAYYAMNMDCDYYVDKFEGATAHRTTYKIINVETNNDGFYKYSIPLDMFKSGSCEWKIVRISYLINGKNFFNENDEDNEIGLFSNDDHSPTNHAGTNNWVCSNDLTCKLANNARLTVGNSLNTNKSYYFIINLRKQNDNHT